MFTCDHVTYSGYRKTQLHSKDMGRLVPMDHNRLYFLEITCLIQKEAGKVECCDIDLNHICFFINPVFYNSGFFESMVRLRKLPRFERAHTPWFLRYACREAYDKTWEDQPGDHLKGMNFYLQRKM